MYNAHSVLLSQESIKDLTTTSRCSKVELKNSLMKSTDHSDKIMGIPSLVQRFYQRFRPKWSLRIWRFDMVIGCASRQAHLCEAGVPRKRFKHMLEIPGEREEEARIKQRLVREQESYLARQRSSANSRPVRTPRAVNYTFAFTHAAPTTHAPNVSILWPSEPTKHPNTRASALARVEP